MTTPHDWRDDDDDDLAAPYLRAFREDVVPRHAKRKAMLALGLGVAAATSSSAVAATALGGLGRAAVVAVAKSVVGGALAGAVVLGATSYVGERAAPARSPAASATAHIPAPPIIAPRAAREHREALNAPLENTGQANELVDAPVAANLGEASSAVAPTKLPQRGRTPIAPRTASRNGAPTVPPSPTALPSDATHGDAPSALNAAPTPTTGQPTLLGREVRLLDQARAALARGDAAAARHVLDGYAREFPSGHLVPESVVVRIEMLLLSGERHAAHTLAAQFENAHPGDSHLGRIRSLLARTRGTP